MRALTVLLIFSSLPTVGAAQVSRYVGPHPVDLAGHWHVGDESHEHGTLPVGRGPFVDAGGQTIFLGDPIAYGWDQEVWTFRGAHPLPGGLPGYCGVAGDHRHPFAPEGHFRRLSGGAYRYVGGLRGGLAMLRPERLAPRHPVVAAPAVASPAPYLFWGCPYRLLPGAAAGSLLPTPLDVTCVPRSARSGGTLRTTRPAATAPQAGSWFDGNYTRMHGVDARLPRGRSASDQRR